MSQSFVLGHAPDTLKAHIQQSSNKRYKSLQGTYNPRVGGKYCGPLKKPTFRSKIELKLMTMLDNPNATNVDSWYYEAKKIPYQDKSTLVPQNGLMTHPTRQYVIDFIVNIKTANGLQTYWIETKSINDIAVNKTKRKTKNAMISESIKVKNYCKWVAASNAAKQVNARFIVITERELETLQKMLSAH